MTALTPVLPAHWAGLWRVDVGVAVGLVFLWGALLAGLAPLLPTQPASWLTFLALVIMPGYLLADALWARLAARLDLDQIERLALAFPLGMAVLTPAGLAALLLHWTVEQLALGWALTTALVVALWAAATLRRARDGYVRPSQGGWARDEIALGLLLVMAFAVMLPSLTLYKIDGDAYAVNSFAADALAGLPLNQAEPLFGTDLGPGVRMAFNQSLPLAYLWSYWSGLDAITLTAVASRPMIALWAILAAYMLGRAAGDDLAGPLRGRRLGLVVAALQTLIYLAAPFLRGDNVSLFFFERTTADKFMVPVTMLPVALALGMHFLRRGERGAWWAAAATTFAVSAIHPLIAAMLALALGAFAGLHLLLHVRDGARRLRSIALGSLVVVAMALPLVQLVLARGEAPLAASYPRSLEGWPVGQRLVPALPFVHVPTLEVYGPLPDLTQMEASEANSPTDPFLIWRFAVNMARRRLLLFSLDRYISDPNIVLEPPYILALLLLPLLLPGIRRSLGAQLAVSSSAAVLVVMFNPLITPLIGSLVMPWILWRFVWLLPTALILALAAAPLAAWLSGVARDLRHNPYALARPTGGRLAAGRLAAVPAHYAPLVGVVALTLLLSPLIARNLQTLQERAAFPYFFPTPIRLLSALDALTRREGPGVVMADQDLSVPIPAYVANAHIVAHRVPTTSEVFPAGQQTDALQRLIDQAAFFNARYLTDEMLTILARYDARYVIAPSGSNLEIQLRLWPEAFTWELDDQSYSLYTVQPWALDTANHDAVVDAVIRGNTALAERQWAEAEAHYQRALAAQPQNLLALAGLAEIEQGRGRFNNALQWYQTAAAYANLPVLHFRLGQLYTQLGQVERAVVEFDLAQQAAPNVARYHLAAGDACLSIGDETCAAAQYAQAAANRNLPDDASGHRSGEMIAQADMWRQRGRADQALALYAEAVRLQPSEANQLMLASAYYEEQRYEEAAALLRALRHRYPFSIESVTLAAEVEAAQGDYAAAERLYRQAIWRLDLTGQEAATTRLALAATLVNAGRLTQAQLELDRVLELQPNNAVAYALQGDILRGRLDPAGATAAYQKAFRLDPTQVQLYLALNTQFRQMGGPQSELLQLLEAALRANPDEPTLALALGDQLQRQGETARAIDAYQTALDMFESAARANSLALRGSDTSRAYAYTRLAAVSEDLGLIEPAMNYYSAAVAAAPDRAWTQLMIGDALRRRNDVAAAESAYRRAIANDPQFANAYVQLADLLVANGNHVEAAVLQQQALEVAFAQAATPRVARTLPGLGSQTPNADLLHSFGSDVDLTGADSDPQAQADRLLGELAAEGGDLFSLSDGSGVLNLLTRVAQTTGDVDRAIDLFQQVLEQGRREGWTATVLAQYYKGLGDLYLARGLPVLAAEAYRNAISLDSWWPQPHLGLARALESMGQYEQELAHLQNAVNVAPGYVEAQVALADFYARRGEDATALELYRATAAAHPGNPRATLALAQAWQGQQLFDEAERVYRRALALTPGHSEAYVDLAALLLEQARYQEAEPMLLAALETNQRNMNAYMQMGILAQRQGNPQQAVEWFKRAARVRPTNQPVNLVLVDLLQRYGHYALSLTYLVDALTQQPTNLEMVLRQARAQRNLGRTGDALTTLLAAARLNLTDAELSAELGELYLAQGRADAALAAYRQTIALRPDEEAYYIRLAGLWRSQAEFGQAEAILLAGLPRVNRPASVYAALADLYLQQGRAQDAITLLDQALAELGPVSVLVTAKGAYYESQAVQGVMADDSAEGWYRGHLLTAPNDSGVLMALGDHYLRRGKPTEAVAQFEAATAATPTAAGAWLGLGQAYLAANRSEDALAALHQAVTLEPTLADGYAALGKLYRQLSRWEEARAVYVQGLTFAPIDGELYIAYCDFLVDQGEMDAANARLAQADQIAPTVEMLLARSSVYTKLRQRDAALADLLAAQAKEPGSLSVLLALGDYYRDVGDASKAQAAYAAATQMSPGIAAGRVRLARLAR